MTTEELMAMAAGCMIDATTVERVILRAHEDGELNISYKHDVVDLKVTFRASVPSELVRFVLARKKLSS